MTVDIAAGRAV